MDDKELLELAAKAAGYELLYWTTIFTRFRIIDPFDKNCRCDWNPLISDGDALRLAVKLSCYMNIYTSTMEYTFVGTMAGCIASEKHGDDPYAATRRAIVIAAAEIGKAIKG